MKSIVIAGSMEVRKQYIARYIQEQVVKPYNIFQYEGKLKIADSREIKKAIYISCGSEKKLIVIQGELTEEAQQALLKILEELPLNVDVLFSLASEELLLSTLRSRSSLIRLGNDFVQATSGAMKDFLVEIEKTFMDSHNFLRVLLSCAEKLEYSKDEIESLIYGLRAILLEEARREKPNVEKLAFFHSALEQSLILSTYIFHNNLNKRLAFETIFLTTKNHL